MTDADRPQEEHNFEPSEVEATRGREQGLGMGARELAAQRDPGGTTAADEDAEVETGVSINAGDEDDLDDSLGVQGAATDERQESQT
jgi:hypothetical protein